MFQRAPGPPARSASSSSAGMDPAPSSDDLDPQQSGRGVGTIGDRRRASPLSWAHVGSPLLDGGTKSVLNPWGVDNSSAANSSTSTPAADAQQAAQRSREQSLPAHLLGGQTSQGGEQLHRSTLPTSTSTPTLALNLGYDLPSIGNDLSAGSIVSASPTSFTLEGQANRTPSPSAQGPSTTSSGAPGVSAGPNPFGAPGSGSSFSNGAPMTSATSSGSSSSHANSLPSLAGQSAAFNLDPTVPRTTSPTSTNDPAAVNSARLAGIERLLLDLSSDYKALREEVGALRQMVGQQGGQGPQSADQRPLSPFVQIRSPVLPQPSRQNTHQQVNGLHPAASGYLNFPGGSGSGLPPSPALSSGLNQGGFDFRTAQQQQNSQDMQADWGKSPTPAGLGLMTPTGSSSAPPMSDREREKDEQIRMLVAQMKALQSSVSHILTASSATPSGFAVAPSGAHGQRHVSANAGSQIMVSHPSQGGFASPLVDNGDGWKTQQAQQQQQQQPPASRSPVLRPVSSNSQMPTRDDKEQRRRSGLLFAGNGANGIASPSFEHSGGWGDSSAMQSPIVGLLGTQSLSGMPGGLPSPVIGQGGTATPPGSLASKWETLGVGSEVFRCIVKHGMGPPTKIQAKAIPCVLRNQDVVAQAPAIQERIQCYVVPALQMLLSVAQASGPDSSPRGIQVIIVTATVDQSAQAQRLAHGLGSALGFRTHLCMGGNNEQEVLNVAHSPPQILVGTPQKLVDFLSPGKISVADVRLLVVDECDQLIARNLSEYLVHLVRLLPPSGTGPGGPGTPNPASSMRSPLLGMQGGFDSPYAGGNTPRMPSASGFSQSSAASSLAVGGIPDGRQTAIFSCTVPQDVLNFASSLQLREPVRVLVRREGGATESRPEVLPSGFRGLKQFYLYIALGSSNGPQGNKPNFQAGRRDLSSSREWKLEALADLCEDTDFQQAVIYCSSVDNVEAVTYKLASRNMDALALHADMGQAARHQVLAKFRSPGSIGMGRMGSKRCLVIYDALARNLADLGQVPLVLNFDLPRSVDDYTPRVACAVSAYGRPGTVVNFVTPGPDVDMLRAVEAYFRCKIGELPPSFQLS